MTFYGASYLPPTSSSAMFDSTSFNRGNEALTYQTALDNFLSYPQAQGTENLKTTNISGLTTLTNDLIINGMGNFLQFPDSTQQTTAFVEANYAQLNTDNTFLAPYIQTFQGSTAPNGTTAPLRIAGNNSEYISLYIDPTPNLDATLYSAQITGGLTISNSGGNSFTMTPSAPNNTAYFSNPISCGSQPFTCGSITSSGAVNANTLAIATSGTVAGNTIATLEGTQTFTGAKTFSSLISGSQLSLSTSGSISGSPIITQATLPSLTGYASLTGDNNFTGTNTINSYPILTAVQNGQTTITQTLLTAQNLHMNQLSVNLTTISNTTSATITINSATILAGQGYQIQFQIYFPEPLIPVYATSFQLVGGPTYANLTSQTGSSFNLGITPYVNYLNFSSGGTYAANNSNYTFTGTIVISWTT